MWWGTRRVWKSETASEINDMKLYVIILNFLFRFTSKMNCSKLWFCTRARTVTGDSQYRRRHSHTHGREGLWNIQQWEKIRTQDNIEENIFKLRSNQKTRQKSFILNGQYGFWSPTSQPYVLCTVLNRDWETARSVRQCAAIFSFSQSFWTIWLTWMW